MPNDAKLGLFVGVIGVIAVAVMSIDRPATVAGPPVSAANPSPAAVHTAPPPHATVTPSADPPSTPVAKTRPEVAGTPAARGPMDDLDR